MDAVLLAAAAAFLFGAMTVALRPPLRLGGAAESGALLTIVPALGVVGVAAALRGVAAVDGTWPFLLAGLLWPGCMTLFLLGVRHAGASRTSVVAGSAPLFSTVIALVFLGETLVAGLAAGAVLIVVGGVLLVGERTRPESFLWIGLVFALGATLAFATRDNLVRWLSLDTDVSPELAALATVVGGTATILAWVIVARRPLGVHRLPAFVPAGVLFGLSYVCVFEAYYRGPVTVVSPMIATESLWGVGLAALLLGRQERVGPRLVAGAVLVVAGGVLIGLSR
jgi:drug/metabolite transporter (DMT)-like permease